MRRELTLWTSIEVRDYWFAKWSPYPPVGPRVFGKEAEYVLSFTQPLKQGPRVSSPPSSINSPSPQDFHLQAIVDSLPRSC